MGLVVERSGTPTTSSLSKPQMCFTCKTRQTGIFTVDAYGKPMCPACAKKAGRSLE